MTNRILIAALAAGALLAGAPPVWAQPPATAPAAPVTTPTTTPPATTTITTPPTTTTVVKGNTPPAQTPPPATSGKASETVVLAVIAILALVGMAALVAINAALGRTKTWSLSDALSEESDLPVKDAQGNIVMNAGPPQAPVLAPVMVASTSRLIALYGMFAILLLYLGVGVFVIYDVGTGQGLPQDLGKVETFLASGLTLFAPYVVNKFASVFQTFAPKS